MNTFQRRVKFVTLGCRLNQYETQAIREQFVQAGFEETQSDLKANIFVLNTCTVTSESDRQSRYLIRRFHRENPQAKIIVTGCYVERDESTIQAIPGVTLTILNRQKSEILNLLESCTSFSFPMPALPSKRTYTPLSVSQFEGRTRAYVKIQDGCNHACAFCKVVLVRGPARSRALQDAVDEAKRLADQGFQEVVLTGIQLGSYGFDFGKRQMLCDLLERLSGISNLKRIRLSSIEPTDVTDELIQAIASMEKVCPHLHIPLQSGDDQVLERMNRRYRSGFYLDLVRKIKERVAHFVLTTDVMVGFPGESVHQFDQTVHLLLEAEPYKLHLFPYSTREGTRAAKFQSLVDGREIERRREVLLLLEEKLRRQVQESFLGGAMDILVEGDQTEDGWASGRAANYLQVHFPVQEKKVGSLFKVQIERIAENKLVGSLLNQEERIKYDFSSCACAN
ncbi:MAG: tRNA (N(6)-L-threonylcarbamoyladenosine(37)-C(2))-methylthiotransferase MtaB [Candidatus Omnitrophica bacterium]|nr:tRNA (N(6)-L-threonylcarbamoyladenosine(37)-C(2))-methylthiotransferase MtaB [Candidatus Omnitrophota bacterium]